MLDVRDVSPLCLGDEDQRILVSNVVFPSSWVFPRTGKQ